MPGSGEAHIDRVLEHRIGGGQGVGMEITRPRVLSWAKRKRNASGLNTGIGQKLANLSKKHVGPGSRETEGSRCNRVDLGRMESLMMRETQGMYQ